MTTIPEKPTIDGLEAKWIPRWETEGIYRFDRASSRDDVFAIDTPPPTVSGSLHIGHVFSYTHTDTVARYQRMRGRDAVAGHLRGPADAGELQELRRVDRAGREQQEHERHRAAEGQVGVQRVVDRADADQRVRDQEAEASHRGEDSPAAIEYLPDSPEREALIQEQARQRL